MAHRNRWRMINCWFLDSTWWFCVLYKLLESTSIPNSTILRQWPGLDTRLKIGYRRRITPKSLQKICVFFWTVSQWHSPNIWVSSPSPFWGLVPAVFASATRGTQENPGEPQKNGPWWPEAEVIWEVPRLYNLKNEWYMFLPNPGLARSQTTHPNQMIYLSPESEWKRWQ